MEQKWKWNIAGSRETCKPPQAEVLSAPTSPVEQTPQKSLSAGIGRNPLRGSKCKPFFFNLSVGLLFLHVLPPQNFLLSFVFFLNILLLRNETKRNISHSPQRNFPTEFDWTQKNVFSHFTVKQFSFFIKLMRFPFLPTFPPTPTFCLFQR